jgi:hypothetical protein
MKTIRHSDATAAAPAQTLDLPPLQQRFSIDVARSGMRCGFASKGTDLVPVRGRGGVLDQMNDAMLRDIGVERSELGHCVRYDLQAGRAGQVIDSYELGRLARRARSEALGNGLRSMFRA